MVCSYEGWVDFSCREVGSEGYFKLSVSKIMKSYEKVYLVRFGKKDVFGRIVRGGLEIWRLEVS